jgi:hypothetical protein
MAAKRWWPHWLAVLALLMLLWPVLMVTLSPAVASGQAGGCSITSPGVELDATCALTGSGGLQGSFTAPPWSTPCPSTGCAPQAITVQACTGAQPGGCATRVFDLSPPIASATPSAQTAAKIAARAAVSGPVLSIRPPRAAPGTLVTVIGTGFTVAPTTVPPTTPPPTTAPPTTPPPTTSRASPTPSRTGQVLSASGPSYLGPGLGLVLVLAVLAVVYVLLRRRRRRRGPGPHEGAASRVYARVVDAPPPPVIRNVASRPARTVRVEVRRPPVTPHMERRTTDDDSISEPAVRITRIPPQPG